MSMALLGALCAHTGEDLCRYPENTKAKLVAKEIDPFGGFNYYYDLDGKPNTAEVIFHFPGVFREGSEKEYIGACKPIEKLFSLAAWLCANTSKKSKSLFFHYITVEGKKKLVSTPHDLLEGLYETTEPISVDIYSLGNGRNAEKNFLRYPNNFKTRYVAKKIKKEGVCFYFDTDGKPDTAEIVLDFPKNRQILTETPIDSFVSVGQIRYLAAVGYAAYTSTRMPAYFEFKPGVRELVPAKCEYIKGLYKTSAPVSVDVAQIRKEEANYPFRYRKNELARYMGKEDKKNGTTYYFFDLDGDRSTAEVIMLVTNKCKDCADKVNKIPLYAWVSIGKLVALSEEMASCSLSKEQGTKDGTLFGVYKKQKPIGVNIKHLFDKFCEYRKRQSKEAK